MEDYVVEMRHITKQFGSYKANNDISLQLRKGEILALLGENGAGKSTLMGMLSGLLEPTEGEILINNKVVISSNGIEWLCKNVFKQKYLELLEKYKMELTELYIKAGYPYDHFFQRN